MSFVWKAIAVVFVYVLESLLDHFAKKKLFKNTKYNSSSRLIPSRVVWIRWVLLSASLTSPEVSKVTSSSSTLRDTTIRRIITKTQEQVFFFFFRAGKIYWSTPPHLSCSTDSSIQQEWLVERHSLRGNRLRRYRTSITKNNVSQLLCPKAMPFEYAWTVVLPDCSELDLEAVLDAQKSTSGTSSQLCATSLSAASSFSMDTTRQSPCLHRESVSTLQ
jgi:hypothetical protein